MKPKRIVCPVDFSECSQQALEYACQLTAEHSAKLFIIHVDVTGHPYVPGNPGYVGELDEHKRLLEEARPCNEDVDYEHHYLQGNVVDEIKRFVMLRDVDLIVMGTHGRTGLAKVFMGSVAESLAKESPCEVVTVPQPEKQPTAGD